ncbi:MAG: DUF6250 domain-containing protein [Prevotellaceae bacterium]|nr:DUF6250 domain-containing protein [Prevotellaceae bacterium]
MNRYLFLFCMLLSMYGTACAGDWYVEAEGDGRVTWSADSVADIHAPGGLTLWNKRQMSGNVVIEYEARIVSDGRISDLNSFWMASDPMAKDVFVNAKRRGGRFVDTYTMSLYYVGYGGNHNSTTRFRRYDGDARGVTDAKFRPSILREYTDTAHLLRGDHWYKVRLEAVDGRVRYIIDGECLVDYVDPKPLVKGYFGFRTTLAHAQLRGFSYRCSNPDAAPIELRNVFSGSRLSDAPITCGVPFSQGELPAAASLTLQADGNSVPVDQWTLASWPDGSVKWKAIAAVVPYGTNRLSLHKGTGKNRRLSGGGSFPVLFHSDNGDLFDSVAVDGRTALGRAWLEQNGRRMPVTSMRCERNGDVRQCWLAQGSNFSLRLYTYKGSGEMKIVHTAFIDSVTNADGLRSLSLRCEVPMRGEDYERRVLFLMDSTRVQTMDVKPLISRRPILLSEEGHPKDEKSRDLVRQIAAWDGFRLSQLSPLAFSLRKRATSLSPWIGTIEGTSCPGVMALGDRTGSVAFQLTDFWQSYPSTLQVDGARSCNATVSLHLWSPEAEAMRFEHYDTVPHGLNASYEDVQPGMSTACGIARTSTLYITLTSLGIDSLRTLLPSVAQHPQYVPSPEYLHRKRAFGFWSLDNGTAIDTLLDGIRDFYARQQELHQWYGFFNYGDVMHSYDPSRGEWRYDVGGYAWDNTELSTPAMFWYMFLRTGNATAWRLAEAMSRHNAEVDCYHNGPHAGLGTRHNVLHWGCGAKEARISQAFWNRFLYYLTADERMGDVMHEVVDADQLLYRLDPMRLAQPRSDKYPCTAPARLRVGPDWLAYAANWFTEWERTGDARYRDKILAGMRSIAAMPHGLFSGPKALGYDPATGVVSWEGDSAVQNTNHLLPIMGGFEMMNEMMLSLTTPEWSRAWLQHAVEYKHKALTISRNHFRIPRLQAYAWWHTGRRQCHSTAYEDLKSPFPIRYTNDAATFALDAIFMQEVCR